MIVEEAKASVRIKVEHINEKLFEEVVWDIDGLISWSEY